MSESYAYIDTMRLTIQRLDTGDAILAGNVRDPRWAQIVDWLEAGNEIQPPPDNSAVGLARETARQALKAVDWQAKIDAVAAAHARVDDLQAQIVTIRDATTLAQIKAPLLAALVDEEQILNGLIDEAEDNLHRWYKLLQTLAIDDT